MISNLAFVLYGVLQGSVLRMLLFLIYINELNYAIKSSKVHHFAGDANLLHFSKSITRLSKCVNLDMENLTDWLNAKKIFLSMQKTEVVIFKHQSKKIDSEVENGSIQKRLILLNILTLELAKI